jgi:hypothetical protein
LSEKKSCASCAFCRDEQSGYSSWTITGSTYTCIQNLNPGFPLDDESTTESQQGVVLAFAEKCKAFRDGQRLMCGCGVDDETQELIDWARQFAP